MNLVLGLLSIVLCFTMLVLIEKVLKKEGLYIWIIIATITANIVVAKTINICGITLTLGNLLFASNFLATDILFEKYGKEDAKKGIKYGFISTIIFICIMQYALLYSPDETDVINDSLKHVFGINLRVSIVSISLYLFSNYLDIYIYSKIRNKFPKKLWLRNNISTIISNCFENYLFAFFALYGIYDLNTVLTVATVGSVVEIIIAICDTPFLYLSKKLK